MTAISSNSLGMSFEAKICYNCFEKGKCSYCERCKVASYCGRDCQLADWKDGNHKIICELMKNLENISNQAGMMLDLIKAKEFDIEIEHAMALTKDNDFKGYLFIDNSNKEKRRVFLNTEDDMIDKICKTSIQKIFLNLIKVHWPSEKTFYFFFKNSKKTYITPIKIKKKIPEN